MKITFIGTSHGVPEPDRKCSSIMLEVNGSIYFVDMGTSAIDALVKRGKSVDSVKGIFITHMHGDHTNGLLQFVDLITWYYKTPDPLICLPNPDAGRVIEEWLRVAQNDQTKKIRYRKTEPGTIFDDGNLKITAYATQHCPNSFAYLAECEGKRILFTGDLKNPKIDFPITEGRIDLVVCESAHFPATDYAQAFEKLTLGGVCITHYVEGFLPQVVEMLSALRAKGVKARRAADDLEIEL